MPRPTRTRSVGLSDSPSVGQRANAVRSSATACTADAPPSALSECRSVPRSVLPCVSACLTGRVRVVRMQLAVLSFSLERLLRLCRCLFGSASSCSAVLHVCSFARSVCVFVRSFGVGGASWLVWAGGGCFSSSGSAAHCGSRVGAAKRTRDRCRPIRPIPTQRKRHTHASQRIGKAINRRTCRRTRLGWTVLERHPAMARPVWFLKLAVNRATLEKVGPDLKFLSRAAAAPSPAARGLKMSSLC